MTLKSDIAREIGRYRILSELGRGSTGAVFLAEDPNIGRKVALKVFAPDGIDPEMEAEFQKRFVTEAKAAGRLNHPGIVTIYDAGTDTGTGFSYIAMEWVEGQTLHEYLWRHGGKLSPAVAAELVRQAALALDYAHREGVVHRDIKPANLLVGQDGRIRILDFGVAKLARENLTAVGTVPGTPAYMAPEQIEAGKVDGRSDLFSLGTILYECLTGANPFRADSLSETTDKVVNARVDPPRTLEPQVPEALSRVAERALGKAPESRFQSGGELAQALAAAAAEAPPILDALEDLGDLEDLPALDSTMFAVDGARRRSSRRHLAWMAASLVALAGLGLWAVLGRPSPDSPSAAGPAAGRDSATAPEPADTPDPASAPSARPEASPAPSEASSAGVTAAAPGEPGSRSSEPPPAALGLESGELLAEASQATLDLLYVNRLREGRIRVVIDGVEVWSREVSARNPFKRLAIGQRHHIALPVEAGERSIEVRITAPSGVDARKSIQGRFNDGTTRQLQVTLKRRANELELDWAD